MRRFLVIAQLFLALSSAQANDADKLVALNISASGVPPELTSTLSEVLVSALREEAKGRFAVLGQSDISAMISLERQKDLVGCSDTSCFAELGGALGAGRLVAGSLGKVGQLWVLTLRLIDTKNSAVLEQVSDRIRGRDEQLVEAVSQLGRRLLNPNAPQGLGFVRVRDTGTLTTDGKDPRPVPADHLGVPAGLHELALLDGDGELVWQKTVEVVPYDTIDIGAPLTTDASPRVSADETPWYGRFWLWTAVGVVAAAGATTYMLTRSNDPDAQRSGGGSVVFSVPR